MTGRVALRRVHRRLTLVYLDNAAHGSVTRSDNRWYGYVRGVQVGRSWRRRKVERLVLGEVFGLLVKNAATSAERRATWGREP